MLCLCFFFFPTTPSNVSFCGIPLPLAHYCPTAQINFPNRSVWSDRSNRRRMVWLNSMFALSSKFSNLLPILPLHQFLPRWSIIFIHNVLNVTFVSSRTILLCFTVQQVPTRLLNNQPIDSPHRTTARPTGSLQQKLFELLFYCLPHRPPSIND